MSNRYGSCLLCEQIVYLHKKYSNKSCDQFFNRYRAVIKNNKVLCIVCYKEVYINKYIVMNNNFV
jgi:formylmethanofuran dehydrogenase subunit E